MPDLLTYTIGDRPMPLDVQNFLPAGPWKSHHTLCVEGMGFIVNDIACIESPALQVVAIKVLLSRVPEHGCEYFVLVQLHNVARASWPASGLALVASTSLRSTANWSHCSDGSMCVLLPGDIAWGRLGP